MHAEKETEKTGFPFETSSLKRTQKGVESWLEWMSQLEISGRAAKKDAMGPFFEHPFSGCPFQALALLG